MAIFARPLQLTVSTDRKGKDTVTSRNEYKKQRKKTNTENKKEMQGKGVLQGDKECG